jgi:hypothetical protein
MTSRDEVLLLGLIDWVALDRIHWEVARANPTEPLSVIQNKTIELIRSLVTEGLFDIGDLTADGGQFIQWDSTIDESINRTRDVYVDRFDEQNVWPWSVWLSLTEAGEPVAREIETRSPSSPDR